MGKTINLVGEKFGKLYVLGLSKVSKKSPKGFSSPMWVCRCDCGNLTVVRGSALRNKKGTKSCGCLKKEVNTIHGNAKREEKSKEYSIWLNMKNRCRNPNTTRHEIYGGRGITYDIRWESFENFYEDMGKCPEGLTLERRDVNGNYCKENCVWANITDQSFNKRIYRNNKSGRTGVHSVGKKWKAIISKNLKQVHLGTFDTFEEACLARDKAELELYGFIKE